MYMFLCLFLKQIDGSRPSMKCTIARMCNELGFHIGKFKYLENGSEGFWNQIPQIADWIGTMILECRPGYNALKFNGFLKYFYNRINLDNASEIEPVYYRNAMYFFIKRKCELDLDLEEWQNKHGVKFKFSVWTIEVCLCYIFILFQKHIKNNIYK